MALDVPADRLPSHIAFIMDGNGRWARRQGWLRLRGHEQGANSLRTITRHCRKLGIRETTFYALSTENYQRRPREEVRFLMGLLKRYLVGERPELMENNIQLRTIGDVSALPDAVRREIDETMRLTRDNDAMVMRLALNYGARQEILDAVRSIVADVVAGRLDASAVESIDDALFARYLTDPDMGDPDLVVRTAGEYRLSNFLLWQSSYSELWITEQLWPEFDVSHLETALEAYVGRERKYGAVSPRKSSPRKRSSAKISPEEGGPDESSGAEQGQGARTTAT
jgi:undecaprenyl diphosphate synthase